MQIVVTITGAEEVAQKLSDISTHLMGALSNEVRSIAEDARAEMKANAPQATGDLQNTITVDVRDTSTGIEAVIEPTESYAYYVEHGRSAGGAPPIDKIKDWLQAKGLDVRLAYVVSKKIAEGGTTENPFVQKAFEKIEGEAGGRVSSAVSLALSGVFS